MSDYSFLFKDTTVTLSATSTAVQATLGGEDDGNRLLVNNLGPNYAYFREDASSAVAICSDAVIQAYQSYWLAHKPDNLSVSAVCDSGMTAIFKITEGYGL